MEKKMDEKNHIRDVANKLVKNLKDCRDVFDGYLSSKGTTKLSKLTMYFNEQKEINISDLVHESIDLLIQLLEGEENG